MKRILLILLSVLVLFIAGTIIYGKYNAEKARQYREKQLAERHAAYTPSEYWPDRSNVKRVVTYPKIKPVVNVKLKPSPKVLPAPPIQIVEAPIQYTERVVTARDYRQSNQPEEFFNLN